MNQDACCAAVRRYLSRRIGENLVVAERPDRDLRNEAAVEEIWRSPSRGYVVEHTRVEAFEGQIQDDKAFMRFVGPLQDALSGHLPGRFAVAIPWGVASTSGIGFTEDRTEVGRLIKNNAEILRDGEVVELTSEQLPFSLRLLKRNSKDSLVFFSRWIEEEKTKLSANDDGSIQGARVDRIGRALNAKIPKLIATADTCKLPSVLILESNDIALSNVFEVAQAFKAAMQGRSEVPDLVFLVESEGPPFYGWLMKDGDIVLPHENYFEDNGGIDD